jgi:D-alanyl-D-alanine carboxypeptidase
VAVVILQLAEEGKLRLDQTPADILDRATVRDIPNATTATLAQLMNHTSGIPSWEEDPRWIHEARGDAYDPNREWSETDGLSYIRGAKPLGTPGSVYHYSNTNYTLLGLIVQKVTGNRLVAEIRRRILIPLGLRDTYLEGFEVVPEDRVTGRYHFATPDYLRAAGISKLFPEVRLGLIDVSVSRLSPEWAAGGLVTTASNLVKFAVALRDGRLLTPDSLRFMMQWSATDQPGTEVGHGLFRNLNKDGTHLIGHSGGVLGFSADMGWLEESDVALAFLYNAGSVNSGQVPLQWTGVKKFAAAARAYAKTRSDSSRCVKGSCSRRSCGNGRFQTEYHLPNSR